MGRYLVVRLSIALTLLDLTVLVVVMPQWTWAALHPRVPFHADEIVP